MEDDSDYFEIVSSTVVPVAHVVPARPGPAPAPPAKRAKSAPRSEDEAGPSAPPRANPVPTCPICFEAMTRGMTSGKCGHVFCETCVSTLLTGKKSCACPTCKQPIARKQLRKLFMDFEDA